MNSTVVLARFENADDGVEGFVVLSSDGKKAHAGLRDLDSGNIVGGIRKYDLGDLEVAKAYAARLAAGKAS